MIGTSLSLSIFKTNCEFRRYICKILDNRSPPTYGLLLPDKILYHNLLPMMSYHSIFDLENGTYTWDYSFTWDYNILLIYNNMPKEAVLSCCRKKINYVR